jgi:hypothetical protein
MVPSKQLKEAVANKTTFPEKDLAEWLELMQKMNPVSGFTKSEWIKNLLDKNQTFDCNRSEESMIRVVISLTPEIDDDSDILLSIEFDNNNKAWIQPGAFGTGSDNYKIPKYLKEKLPNTFGFSGTWEEVMRKWIELNNTINSQTQSVPEDLKK